MGVEGEACLGELQQDAPQAPQVAGVRPLFRGGLVFKAHRLFVSLSSRLESNQEEEETTVKGLVVQDL